ncbi:arginine decarboxylase [Geobacillus subterraneus]|uniref:Arginine decarboxylase n=2 Tax=Geobacillus TaxID=129337 RepID=A0ABM6AEW9_9BACL|nr:MULTISPECIES: aminotransferase class I/II-fold pyridoxal phosphate-dependent enzyme [Geobacillus]AMX84924.1 arginine decarboxylase [Geobacillus subterraneus]KZS25060.1 arginine decarboxylase [Geobacillus subterraneus]OXB85092.1 arginine decarboxylase [Geobacillus uzenensis]QIZ66245.1 aminotransferase class I/II-fold pyridoxal phosphate-dependent enzyme [Geobacillus subterraneus]WPZ18447.1 aminotransferase class I/II-fold pyridoxal phosphate-dependent enzyme [Geobacillus subterraneus]
MNQAKTPLYDALMRHWARRPISFHVPGHKYGAVFSKRAGDVFSSVLTLDATEISGLDDLHHPEAAIAEAQALAAELYGAEETFFLVNGSTAGNLAMIAAVCDEKKRKVIVQRNCHKSVMHALQLMGATPVLLSPEFDSDMHVASHVCVEAIKEALALHRDAAAVVLTNPNYYGMSIDLTEIVRLAHDYGVPVLVDEAHGAHFVLGPPFPKPALACGADVVVQSAHKTLPAMTMGAFLHVNSGRIDVERLKYFLQLFQSSSPSYPIMASLDLARSYVAELAEDDVAAMAAEIEEFKAALAHIDGVAVVSSRQPDVQTDLLKVTVQTRSSLTGYELQQRLEREGVFTELADPLNVLLVCPLAATGRLMEAVRKMKRAWRGLPADETPLLGSFPFLRPPLSVLVPYDELRDVRKKAVALEEAEGYVAAETVIPYPPGVPLMWIGERIDRGHIEQIRQLLRHRAHVQGGSRLGDGLLVVYELR